MSQPNFIVNFVLGKTDYFLSAPSFERFLSHYARDGVGITEQVLDMPDNQKGELINLLKTNLLPENMEYRYNFVFDNCTTRPRDIIEKLCGGMIIDSKPRQPVTFRQLFHQYTKPNPWLTFGIDCVIGSGADSLISLQSELFLPEKLMDALEHWVVKKEEGSGSLLVLDTKPILPNKAKQVQLSFWNTPFAAAIVIFIICLASCLFYLRAKRREEGIPRQARDDRFLFRLLFALLFFFTGVGGCIVFMLNFFSLHPCVQSNWNLLWLHPLHFIAVAGFFFRKSYSWIRWYHAVNFVLLSVLLLGWHWIPQELNKTCIPLILCLWMVSGLQAVVLKQKRI
jgi:hypothetical protein